MNKSIETLDSFISKDVVRSNVLKSVNRKRLRKSKFKIVKISIMAIATAGIILLSGSNCKSDKEKNNELPKETHKIADSIDYNTVSVDDLGKELKFLETSNTQKYGNTTGNVDTYKVVVNNNKVYKDQEASNNAINVGNKVVDTKGDTLNIESDGTVVEKKEDYEIYDDKGNIIETGKQEDLNIAPNGAIIKNGEAWDNEISMVVSKDMVGKYTYSDATYYDPYDSSIVLKKGELVLKENLEKVKKLCTTVKPINADMTTSSTITSSKMPIENEVSSVGIVNEDGTYTIYGMTFESKADYEQWIIQEYTGYAEVKGIMIPEERAREEVNQKVLG